ncbi:MAG: hypothetical protein R3B99_34515 [Polyangiales bacterium]
MHSADRGFQTAAGMGTPAERLVQRRGEHGLCRMFERGFACATDNGCDDEWGERCCPEHRMCGATTQEEFDACVETELDTTSSQNTAFLTAASVRFPRNLWIDPVCVMT